MKIFAHSPIFRPRIENDRVLMHLADVKVVSRQLMHHLYAFVPKINTPYGPGTDLHIIAQGNGTYALRLWTDTSRFMAEGLSLAKAEEYLTGHYLALFSSIQNPWKNYWASKQEAFNEAIDLLAECQNLPPETVRQNLLHKHPPIYSDLVRGYENLLENIPGEAFSETVQRLHQIVGNSLPQPVFYAIVRYTRTKE